MTGERASAKADQLAGLSAAEKRALVEQMLRRRETATAFPTSFGQQRLWFLDRLNPGSPAYNVPVGLRFTGPLVIDPLQRALDAIVSRHAVLRTTFAEHDGQPVQRIAPPQPVTIAIADVGGFPAQARMAQARALAEQEACAPFDLARGPLLRASLIRLADDDHVLVLNLHHVVCDAWSLSVLLHELDVCYTAFAAGRTPDLPPLRFQYSDFATWQREKAASDSGQRQIAYWVGRLSDAPALLTLPTDRPRAASRNDAGNVHYVDLPRRLSLGLRSLGRSSNATLFMTILAAFQAVLARYSGQSDIVVGAPVAGRTRTEFAGLIGFFLNTLALRTLLRADQTFRELVADVRDTTLDALSNADVPFERLVEILQPVRTSAQTPIFQVQLVVLNTPAMPDTLGGLPVTSLALETDTAKFDLSLVVQDHGEDLTLAVEYATGLFDIETIVRFTAHLVTLIEAVVTDPDRKLADISLLTKAELEQLSAWNATAHALPPASTVVRLLAPQFAARENDLAVLAGEVHLTYGELARAGYQLAHLLRSRGVGPDDPVGLCLTRSADLLVGALGIWFAGAGYLPLDPQLPPGRLRAILRDAKVATVVTQQPRLGLVEDLLDGTGTIVCVDDSNLLGGYPATPLPTATGLDHLAYLIYTSGSTGRPKGVAVTHRGAVNLLLALADAAAVTPADRWGAITTLSFDISVPELFLPLLRGGQVVIVDADTTVDGVALRRQLEADRITVLQATPTTWRMLLSAGGVPEHVRVRISGGEALPADLADALQADGATLWNGYGPTETTVYSALGVVPPLTAIRAPG